MSDPSDGFENVVINYEYSEYEFDADSHQACGDQLLPRHGRQAIPMRIPRSTSTPPGRQIVPTSGINDGSQSRRRPEYVVINFAYHVKDTKKNW